MGMFSCFQSPRRTRECSACSPCWGDRIRRYISPDSPIVRHHNHPTPFASNHQQQSRRHPDPSPPRERPQPRNHSPPRQAAVPRNPSPPRLVVEARNHSPPRELAHPRNPSPPRLVVEARNPSPPRELAHPRNPSPPRLVFEARNPSPPRELAHPRKPSPPRPVAEVRNPSPPRQPTHHRNPSPPRRGRKLGPRFYSPPRSASRTKYRDYSRARQPSRPKHGDYSPRQASTNKHQDCSPPRHDLRAKPRDKTPPRRRRANKIEPRDYSPPRQAAKIGSRDSPPPRFHTRHRILPPGSRDSSPSRNAAPKQIPAPPKIHHGLKDNPPIVLPAKVRESPPDPSNPNVSPESESPIVHHHHFREAQMGRKDQQEHHTHIWVDHDADHVHEWESYEGSVRGQNLADELQREAAHDRAAQARGESGSPRSVTESCADSYCTRAENPLRQQKYESKFPFGTPENRPISPPGWTYSPKRKTSRGEWWDKDWPKNKRYIFYDPNLQPCGCHWSKRHAGSRTPSPPSSARARGIAYADSLVKINRDRSLSPRTGSRQGRGSPTLVPAKEPPHTHTHRHRHEHLNWSCSTSRASSRPASRPITPKKVYNSGRSSPFWSRPQSPRSSPKLAGALSTPRKASPSEGCCVSFSRSTTPARNQKPHSSRHITPRPVRSRVSAPPRQRPKQHSHVYVSSSSACSTPTSICVQSPGSDGSSRTVNSMGHCHTYGSWNCSPYEDPPAKKIRAPTPPRTPDYTVTITCPQNEESIGRDGRPSEVVTVVPCHCHCSANHGSHDHCHPSSNMVIAGHCDWHHIAHHHHHHHHRADHCCCGCSHCDW